MDASAMKGAPHMLFVLINIAIVIVVGAILFYIIDKSPSVTDGLPNLLKILVGLICLLAILQRLLPVLGVGGVLDRPA